MPCNCDHLEPSLHERESQRVAQHIVYVTACLSMDCPKWVADAAVNIYGAPERIHELTRSLCALCEQASENVIYNARDKQARALADWWEAHQEADAKKARAAKEKAKQERLKQDGLAKLNDEERDALGL